MVSSFPVLKFSTLAGGVFIEDAPDALERTGAERCFRFDSNGNAEWAVLKDLTDNGTHARWFGHQLRAADFTFA